MEESISSSASILILNLNVDLVQGFESSILVSDDDSLQEVQSVTQYYAH